MPKSSKLYRLSRQVRFTRTYTAPDLFDSPNTGMNDHLKRFKRELPGLWTCLTTTTIGGVTIPSGARLIAGVPYDGVDVAALLEQEYAKQHNGSQGSQG
jgi:hypothetical protein